MKKLLLILTIALLTSCNHHKVGTTIINRDNYKTITLKEVETALNNGADVGAVDKRYNWTALMYAVSHKGDPKIVESLIKHGADVNYTVNSNITPLISATENGTPEIIEILLKAGADVNAKNYDGMTALQKSVLPRYAKDHPGLTYPRIEIPQILLNHGADVNSKDKKNWGILMYATANHPSFDLIKLLVDHGVDINKKDNKGYTPLSWLANSQHPAIKIIKFLVEHGGDVNTEDKYQQSLLYRVAIRNESLELTKYFLDHGAKPTQKFLQDIDEANQYDPTNKLLALFKKYPRK